MSREWWRQAVVYQVYPRSFADGDGDGQGDLVGLRERLGHIASLGVDAIWITPWYASPFADGGYDVADFRAIAEVFGTLGDAEQVLADARALGLRTILDLVPNHVSDQHAWFRQAVTDGPGAASRERFHFRDGAERPSNWVSNFGGPAWTAAPDGEWYLHLFAPQQPDLNWGHPEVRQEFLDVMRFWLDRGVDGFRMDVAHALFKDLAFPDVDGDVYEMLGRPQPNHPHWDRDEVHEVIRTWRALLDTYPERMMVAEAWVQPDRLPLYLRPDEYHQAFDFSFMDAPWDAGRWRAVIDRSLTSARAVGSTPTWVLGNHDMMRPATRLGLPVPRDWRRWLVHGPEEALDAAAGLRRARAAMLLTLALPGSAYLYQGEELGLPEAWQLPWEVLDDPRAVNTGGQVKGRDGCRVPLPWTEDGPSMGFGTGEPWLPQPASFRGRSVAAQEGVAGSTLELTRAALRLRRAHLGSTETLEWLDLGAEVVALRRPTGLVCVTSFGAAPTPLPRGRVLLASAPLADGRLPADATAWLLVP